MSDYERIARAIAFLNEHVTEQPSLDALAAHLHLSPFHCQRLFARWAGTSPKRFLQVATLELGKRLLEDSGSVLSASTAAGLSSPSRLYDHFVQLEAVTPGEYKSGGANLDIEYGFHDTPLGTLLLASTARGICKAAFVGSGDEREPAVAALAADWPQARLRRNQAATGAIAGALFAEAAGKSPLTLHVRGTNFQLAIWRALLRIPAGSAVSYATLGRMAGHAGAARAVGNAVGANPVALLIPCHRVIRESGALGGYRWGPARKQLIQVWERLRHAGDEATATAQERDLSSPA